MYRGVRRVRWYKLKYVDEPYSSYDIYMFSRIESKNQIKIRGHIYFI